MSKWMLPFPDSAITGHFGKVRTFRGAPTNPHRGTDWAPGANKIIPNITAGKVALIQWSNIMGWGVVIETDAKDTDGKPWFVSYHHLSCAKHGVNCKGPKVEGQHSPLFSTEVGDRKEMGKPVGRIGNTGSASSGPHGHFCLSKTLKGAWNGKVYDLHAHIKSQMKLVKTAPVTETPAPKPATVKPETPAAPVVQTETITVFACPHCKKELK